MELNGTGVPLHFSPMEWIPEEIVGKTQESAETRPMRPDTALAERERADGDDCTGFRILGDVGERSG